MRTPMNVAVVGMAGSSPLAQVFADLPHVWLSWFCSEGGAARGAFGTAWQAPAPRTTNDFSRLLDDEDLDAIAFDADALGRGTFPAEALAAGKHVFLRGPLARTVAEADALVSLAEAHHRCLRAYHAAAFTPGARRLRELVYRDELGELFYVRGTHGGMLAPGEHLLWDWAADTTALVLELLGGEPIEVSARGESHARPDLLETIVADLRFATGISAQLHLSGVDRSESTRIAVVGSESTAVLDGDSTRELALYREANHGWPSEGRREASVSYPALPRTDPLRTACESFVMATKSQANPGADRVAAAVVGVLEVIQQACELGQVAIPRTTTDSDASSVIHLHAR
jgi:predicted dehydrogenase